MFAREPLTNIAIVSEWQAPEQRLATQENGIRSAVLALASLVLAVVVGGLLSRMLYALAGPSGFAANPVPGLMLVGIALLCSGCVYRRWFFTRSRDCGFGVFGYMLIALLFAVYVTGVDAVTGVLDGWIIWLVVVPLVPWFGGFFIANHRSLRSKKQV